MENFKILENRIELSQKELTEAMDFAKLKANVAVVKMAAIKIIITKTILSAVIITSGVVVYNNVKTTAPKQEPQHLAVLADTSKNYTLVEAIPISDKPKEVVKQMLKDTIKTSKVEKETTPVQILKVRALPDTIQPIITNVAPVIPVNKNCYGSVIPAYDSDSREKDTETTSTKREDLGNNNSENKCKIWYTHSFCNTSNAPDYKYTIECDDCSFDYVNCENVDPNGTVCILITLTCNGKQSLKIESKLKNITLTDAKGKNLQTAKLIGIGNDGKFLGKNFKAKKLLINFTKQINVYAFFETAKIGDNIIIKDIYEGVITQ